MSGALSAVKRELSELAHLGIITRCHLRRAYRYVEDRAGDVEEWLLNGATIGTATDLVVEITSGEVVS